MTLPAAGSFAPVVLRRPFFAAERDLLVSADQMLLICGAAAFLIAGYLFAVMVMRVGDIGMIAPFRYTALLWAILLGWLAFGTLPDGWTLIGAGIVVASGLFTLWRERAIRRSVAA